MPRPAGEKNVTQMSITLPNDVAERLEAWSKKLSLPRSQTIALMVRSYMDAEEARPSVLQIAEGFGSLMQNLMNMTPEQAKQKMAEIDAQMDALPEPVKQSAE